jgi:magnesium transporter
MDEYVSVISNNRHTIMKQMTSISIIIINPTLIASLYGMNVPNDFKDYRYGL